MHVSCEQEPREIAGSHLLLAVGRIPNTDAAGRFAAPPAALQTLRQRQDDVP
jgi:hypothetical protein